MLRLLISIGILRLGSVVSASEDFEATNETAKDAIYDADGKIVTEDMSYEELMDFSDSIWEDVEHGIISPQDADTKFVEKTGYDVLDWMIANGEVAVAVDEGTVDDIEENTAPEENLHLFKTGFLEI